MSRKNIVFLKTDKEGVKYLDKKKITWVGIVSVGITLIALLFFFSPEKNEFTDHHTSDTKTVIQHVLSYDSNGTVYLYDIQQENLLDQIDLKTFKEQTSNASETQLTVAEPVSKPEEETHTESDHAEAAITKDEENNEKEVLNNTKCKCLEDFVPTEVTVKKGDNAWKIQKSLTPSRNTAVMLKYVAEINGRMKLHPIYPGEKILFLKEKTSQEEQSAQPEAPKESKKEPALPKNEPEPVAKAANEYVFHDNIEQKALFAYSNGERAIYKISVVDNKLQVDLIVKNKEFVLAKGIYATPDKVLLAALNRPLIQIYDMQQQKLQNVTIQNDGFLTNWLVLGDELYYTFGNRLGKLHLKTLEQKDVLLGDESIDMVHVQDKIFVLNAFGKQVNNSLLMKVNPGDLRVDDFIELKSDVVAIVSKGDKQNLYIGRVDKETETPHIVTINPKNLMLSGNWEIPYSDESMSHQSYFYMLDENHQFSIYPANSSTPIKTFNIKGKEFMIIPQ